jgi:endonuclease/exonuclease/phosphatase (EEP) superfamily protein YafD
MRAIRRIGSTFFKLVDIAAAGLLAATVMGFLGRYFWFFDLFSHFRVQYMQAGLVLIFITLWSRRYYRAAGLLLLSCVNYALVLPLYFGQPEAPDRPALRAMLVNLNASNGNSARVLQDVREADPDLLLLEEVTPAWSRQLMPLQSRYPYVIAEPQEGCFGIMLLSAHPLENGRIVDFADTGVPTILADVYLPNGAVSLIGTHPVPPLGPAYSNSRNRQLAALPALLREQKHPVLLIGDLNTSPWSPHFAALIRESELRNSMQGFGFQPTWPAGMPFMRIPLDHVLHAPEITIHRRFVGRKNGSDHLPVIVDFSVE